MYNIFCLVHVLPPDVKKFWQHTSLQIIATVLHTARLYPFGIKDIFSSGQ